MTASDVYAPIRMPGSLFDEIAAGGGSRRAIAFLVGGERTRRLLLLREFLDRIGDGAGILGPLDAAAIWPAIEAAAEQAPDAVEELLLGPQVGSWLAHTLRRLHGTAAGPPLWADAGQIAAVAAVAALHAGTGTELLLPASGTAVSLPTLGLVRLPGRVEPGFHVVRAAVSGRAITLRREDRGGRHSAEVIVRPLADPESAHWLPVHRLSAGPGVREVQLDDVDPYRDLDEPIPPARLDSDELRAWQELFGDAVAILRRSGPGPGGLRPEEISRIVPWNPPDRERPPPVPAGLSASTGDAFGSMVVARPRDGLAFAGTLVHEFQHSKLGALLHLFPLLDDDRAELYYAPWRSDPRHLPGLLHGAYAFVGVTGFWRDRIGDGAADPGGRAAFLFALRRLQTRMVLRTIATRARLTVPGRRLVDRLCETVDGWLREPVEPGAEARAKAAAVSHRVEWRLRNLRCEEGERAALVKAFRSGADPAPGGAMQVVPGTGRPHWQDDRGLLYLNLRPEPGAALSADELLVGGDAGAALERYAAQLLPGSPLDPHALGGWLLAYSALHPEHRRLLARPERFAAVLEGSGTRGDGPETWAGIAQWLVAGERGGTTAFPE